MLEKLTPALRKAVREYYEWHGDKHGSAQRIVSRPGRYGREYMVLAHIVTKDDDKLSTMMIYSDWADGHYDVTEIYVFPREDEKDYLDAWREVGREDVKIWKAERKSGHADEEEDDLDDYHPERWFTNEAEVLRRKRTCAACDDDYERNMIL